MASDISLLAGCWAKIDRAKDKIDRAKEKIGNLGAEITAILNSGIYSIVGENQFDRQRYVFKLFGPPVPIRIAVIAGEIIHHLRSCFDHVVWALASKSGLPDTERVNFPVCETPQKYAAAVRNGSIKGVPKIAHPTIEGLQPYRASDPPNSSLQILHDMDILDKHRLLLVVTHALVLSNTLVITKNDCPDPTFGIELPPIATDHQGQLTAAYPWGIEDGIEVHSIPLRGPPNPQFEIEVPGSTIQIAFEKVGTLQRPPVIPILNQLCVYVESSVHLFDPFF